jgi:hypothetical protein
MSASDVFASEIFQATIERERKEREIANREVARITTMLREMREHNVQLSKALADAEDQRDAVTRALADAQEALKDALAVGDLTMAIPKPSLPDSMSDTEHYNRWAESLLPT